MSKRIDPEKLYAEWEQDCQIDEFKLDDASLKLPQLHSKYLRFYDLAKKQLRELEYHQTKLLKMRMDWYEGTLSKEEMDALGWPYDPYDGKLVKTKQQKEYYYKTDEVLLEMKRHIEEQKDIVDAIKEMLENIKWRHQTISNAIRWKQFEAGM